MGLDLVPLWPGLVGLLASVRSANAHVADLRAAVLPTGTGPPPNVLGSEQVILGSAVVFALILVLFVHENER